MPDAPDPELTLFSAARRLPPDQRPAYLDQACAGNAALRKRIEDLLQASEEAGPFLQNAPATPARPPGTIRLGFESAEKAGDQIGRYKLLQQIGEGGCGVVYMAEQEQPVKRRVALKVIKLGMDTKSVIARFEAERQALAMMDHPNIAKVLDAGATEKGRPYFVMELVRGIKITDYCDQNHLSTKARLDLFVLVCRAVQHAHQKGIIHRDIKPSNILVTMNDGVPIPKVIDFGIAKATLGKLTDQTLFTAFEQFMGTPAYMSPEQAEMSALDIDTRSDIYSLGVLLYELLTGQTPFDAKELLKAGLDEMRRQIREKEPARPSTRLSTMLAADLTNIAVARQSAPPKLVHLVRGDLDWIVMKCLEKDRTRRYETTNGLAADIQRHLNNEPVLAAAPTAAYRVRKFVRRHRTGVLAGSILLLTLLAGIVGTTWGWVEALRQKRESERQSQIAQHTTGFLTNMFESIDPAVAQLREITVREVLDVAAGKVSTAFPNEPLVELPIRGTIIDIYGKLGRQDLALPQAQEALLLAKNAYGGGDHEEVALSQNAVASCLQDLGRLEEALSNYDAVLQMEKRLHHGDDPNVASSLNNRSLCLVQLGRAADALPGFEAAVAMHARLSKGDSPEASSSLNNLGLCLDELGRPTEGLARYEEALAMTQRLHKGDHPDVAANLNNVASCLNQLGRPTEALPKSEEALAMRQRIYKGDHPEVAESLNDVAYCLGILDRPAEAMPKYAEALAMRQRLYKGDHPEVARSFNNLGSSLYAMGRFAEALTNYQAALEMNRRLNKGDHPDLPFNFNNIANCLTMLGRPDEALLQLQEALAMRQRLYPNGHPNVGWSQNTLAGSLVTLGRWDEALQQFEAASQLYQRILTGDHPYKARNLQDTGSCLSDLGRGTEALPKLQAGLEMRQRIYKGDHTEIAESLCTLADCLRGLDRTNEAAAPYQQARTVLAHLSDSQPENKTVRLILAKTLRGEGDLLAKIGNVDSAKANYEKGLQIAESILASGSTNAPAGKLRLNFRTRLGLDHAEVVVMDVEPGSQGQRIGLQKGDVITRYAGQQIANSEQWTRLNGTTKGTGIELEIRRNGQSLKYFVTEGALGAWCPDRAVAQKPGL